MQEITFSLGVKTVLHSLLNDRLALLAGAGLSMAPPSCLPSAASIAASAKQKYDAMYGGTPLPECIEDQAEFFFNRNELGTVYFRTFIDQHAFASRPNSGHFAIADLLLVQAIKTAITTNVDTLVEMAGQQLYGRVGVGLDGHEVAALAPDISPVLKIHGCFMRDCDNMVWAPGQLSAEPVASRIASSTACLNTRLLDRDLLIVGYSTDCDYLNTILETTLGAVNPVRVIVVDLAEGATFAAKAPALYAIGQRATMDFLYVQASGADFLDALRLHFSKSFVRRVLRSGENDYSAHTGTNPDATWMEPPHTDTYTLWQMRRDLEGRLPCEPAKDRNPPPAETLVGLTLLQLQAAGAVTDGPYWSLNGRRVRVLRAVNKLLHRVEAEFERETAPPIAPDVVIAVGAEAQSLPKNFARAVTQSTIARGSSSRWLNRLEAVQELGL